MSAASDFAHRLNAKRSGTGWMARCPAHDDRTASLSINESKDGKLLLHCHAGCDFQDILTAAGADAGEPNGHAKGRARIVATYDYHDATGKRVFQVVRFEPKDFRQRAPNGSGGWIWSTKSAEKVPYRLPQLLNANEIFIVEGEKDADALAKLGLVATTNPGGADKDGKGGKKWPETFSRWFEGRHAILIPDNDERGNWHVRAVAQKLQGKAASIRILELPNLPPKGDVSDWLFAGGTRDELEEMAAAAPQWEPPVNGQLYTNGETTGAVGLTEDELAEEFTRRHSHHLRYVAAWGAWMRWTGQHWQREATLEAFDLARAVCRDGAAGLTNAKLRARILSASTRAAVENLARSDRAHAAVTEQWDTDLFSLHEPKGRS
jgi:putative DNA primase/helicase